MGRLDLEEFANLYKLSRCGTYLWRLIKAAVLARAEDDLVPFETVNQRQVVEVRR